MIVVVDVIKTAGKTKTLPETVCGGIVTKRLIIRKFYVAPPPLPILTFGESTLTKLQTF
jgi:hypothetical protein